MTNDIRSLPLHRIDLIDLVCIKTHKNIFKNNPIFSRYIPGAKSIFNVTDIYDSTSFDITMQLFWYNAVIKLCTNIYTCKCFLLT